EPDAGMRAAAAELAPGANFVEDVGALALRDDIDALVIASPNHLHLDQIEALSVNPRPLLVEKPLYTDMAQAARLEAIAASYKAPVWVAME
ncbi:MAG TPA: oxidoreductase, partial [Alphaproteobacteria bacterium]|nr:oxidoreductase [Alphaproteobacteria bacterium]